MRRLFGASFALWSVLLGVLLPYINFFGHHFVNIVWGVVYGFGLFLTDFIGGLTAASRTLWIGGIVWPIAVAWAMFMLGVKILRAPDQRVRWLSIGALTLSSLASVDLRLLVEPPLEHVPTYFGLTSNVY